MVVAYHFPHNDGIEYGILDAPGQDTGISLVDLYEVDGSIKSFETRADAEEWLRTEDPHLFDNEPEGHVGVKQHYSYEERRHS